MKEGATMFDTISYRIAAADLSTFCGIVAEDVVSPHGALLLSKETDFSLLPSPRRRMAALSLLKAGVLSVSVRERAEVSLNEILEIIAKGKRPSEIRARQLYEDTIYYLKAFCKDILFGEPANLHAFTLLRAGRILAETVAADPDILLHLVGLLSAFLANRVFPEREMTVYSIAAGGLLHDIGKNYIPEDILSKPGELSSEELAYVRRHSAIGDALLRKAGVTDVLVLKMVRHHHERMDGSGYPDGLAGESIPYAARIAAVADVFDAVTSERAYKKRMSGRKGIALLIDNIGTHLDSGVVKVFVGAFGMYPPGTEVLLSDGRTGIVTAPGGKGVLRPRVLLKRSADGSLFPSHAFLDLAAEPSLFIRGPVEPEAV